MCRRCHVRSLFLYSLAARYWFDRLKPVRLLDRNAASGQCAGISEYNDEMECSQNPYAHVGPEAHKMTLLLTIKAVTASNFRTPLISTEPNFTFGQENGKLF